MVANSILLLVQGTSSTPTIRLRASLCAQLNGTSLTTCCRCMLTRTLRPVPRDTVFCLSPRSSANNRPVAQCKCKRRRGALRWHWVYGGNKQGGCNSWAQRPEQRHFVEVCRVRQPIDTTATCCLGEKPGPKLSRSTKQGSDYLTLRTWREAQRAPARAF